MKACWWALQCDDDVPCTVRVCVAVVTMWWTFCITSYVAPNYVAVYQVVEVSVVPALGGARLAHSAAAAGPRELLHTDGRGHFLLHFCEPCCRRGCASEQPGRRGRGEMDCMCNFSVKQCAHNWICQLRLWVRALCRVWTPPYYRGEDQTAEMSS